MKIGKMTPEEQQKILVKIGREILEHTNEEWDSLVYRWNGLEEYSTDGLYVYLGNSAGRLIQPPASILSDVEILRAGMYQQGRGTWFSMHYTITPPTRYDVTFNYDNPPDFLFPASPHDYVDDLHYFPRSPEHIPTWLQQKINEANNNT